MSGVFFFLVELKSLNIRKVSLFAACFFLSCFDLDGLVLVNLLHEFANFGVGVQKVDVIIPQDLLNSYLCFFSSFNDFIAMVALVLVLLEVALNNTMA